MVEELKPLAPTTTASIKHSPTSGQTNINSHTEGPFTTPFLLPRIPCPAFKSRKNCKAFYTASKTILKIQTKHQNETQM